MAHQNSTLTAALTRPGQDNAAGDARALLKRRQVEDLLRLGAVAVH